MIARWLETSSCDALLFPGQSFIPFLLFLPGAGDSECSLQENCSCMVSSPKFDLSWRQLFISKRTGGMTQHTLGKIGVWGWKSLLKEKQIQLRILKSVIYLPLITEQHTAEDRVEKRGKKSQAFQFQMISRNVQVLCIRWPSLCGSPYISTLLAALPRAAWCLSFLMSSYRNDYNA